MDLGSGLAQAGGSIADAMLQYHKEHESYDQQAGLAQALSRLAISEDGTIVPMPMDVGGGTGTSSKKSGLTPIIDPKALELFQTSNAKNRAVAKGQLEALSRIGMGIAAHAVSQHFQDTSVSGQRTKQIMQQSEQSFLLEQRAAEDTHTHMQDIHNQANKATTVTNVPGIGPLTPPQLSAHLKRQVGMEATLRKSEPALKFNDQLQTKYGLTANEVIVAATKGSFPQLDEKGKPVKDADGNPVMFTGVPFVDAAGKQVMPKDGKLFDIKGKEITADKTATPKNKKLSYQVWAKVGNSRIPVEQWSDIVTKSNAFLPKIQAQQVIAKVNLLDPSEITEQDKAAYIKAKQILSQ